MSDTKLDQSLDEIVSTQRTTGGRGRGGRARNRGGRTTQISRSAAPGGIKKSIKPARAAPVPTGPATGSHGDRIQVSNLPRDVNEAQIKEYFVKSVGAIKRVEISYGPGGVSRGIATIAFRNADGAQKAVQALNGLLVDGRPLKIDIILDPRQAATIVSKSLSDRVAPSKNQGKVVVPKKNATNIAATKLALTTAKKGKKRSVRPAKKTAAELDSEMADYFDQGTTTDTAAPVNGASTEDAMEEVL